jgi:hypothetical protein
MRTKKITVSFVVNVSGKVALRDMEMNWIVIDNAETIANDIKDAILNIE